MTMLGVLLVLVGAAALLSRRSTLRGPRPELASSPWLGLALLVGGAAAVVATVVSGSP